VGPKTTRDGIRAFRQAYAELASRAWEISHDAKLVSLDPPAMPAKPTLADAQRLLAWFRLQPETRQWIEQKCPRDQPLSLQAYDALAYWHGLDPDRVGFARSPNRVVMSWLARQLAAAMPGNPVQRYLDDIPRVRSHIELGFLTGIWNVDQDDPLLSWVGVAEFKAYKRHSLRGSQKVSPTESTRSVSAPASPKEQFLEYVGYSTSAMRAMLDLAEAWRDTLHGGTYVAGDSSTEPHPDTFFRGIAVPEYIKNAFVSAVRPYTAQDGRKRRRQAP
jgi:hypothetical protein